VARYAGSLDEGVDAIVSHLWARIEGLGEALGAHEDTPSRMGKQS
jgi:hypothetical protein